VNTVTIVVVASIAAAAIVVLAAWQSSSKEPWGVLDGPIPDPNFDFTKSWASNLTAIGAIAGTILTNKILPGTLVLTTSGGYTALNVVFGFAVLVAPFAFVALRKGKADPQGPQYQGRGVGFLVASLFTLIGVFGELVTAGLMFYELKRGDVLPPGTVIAVWVGLGVTLAMAAWYGFQTIRLLLASTSAPGFRVEDFQPTATSGWTFL
jgi:hypothetical protein